MSGIEVRGIRLEEENEVIIELKGRKYRFHKGILGIAVDYKIDRRKFALVQDILNVYERGIAEYKSSSAVSMDPMFKGEGDFFGLHEKVFASGLKGMDARKFLPHLYNVNEALQGRGVLYDASGNLIEGDNLRVYANRLNHDCWAYVNGHFQKSEKGSEGFRGLDLLTITGYKNGKPVFSRTPLEPCLENDCMADITPESLNSQGMPTKKAPTNRYEDGKTAYFYYPREGAVASFYAGSVRAGFYCYWSPAYRDDSLGVFASCVVERKGEAGR